jgi:phosphoenolpyruvate carboxykinase (GTP)
MDPIDMKTVMTEEYRGAMAGRTMYVIAFCMGPLDAAEPKFGVQITDSEYVAVSMQIMTRSGTSVWNKLDAGADFVRCLHSVGAPLHPGQHDVAWPCDHTKYITHFPEERTIWSYGSGYGGNALLGKKCYALRIASKMAHDEGWLAEHMLIVKLTSPEQRVHYIAAAFPSQKGKNEPGDAGTTLTAGPRNHRRRHRLMRFGGDGRLYAVAPRFFGVASAPASSQPAMATIERGNSIHQRRPDRRRRHLVGGMTADTPAHHRSKRGDGHREERAAAHPNSRYCTPSRSLTVAPE